MEKKKMFAIQTKLKRGFAYALTGAMLFALLPTMAFATSSDATAESILDPAGSYESYQKIDFKQGYSNSDVRDFVADTATNTGLSLGDSYQFTTTPTDGVYVNLPFTDANNDGADDDNPGEHLLWGYREKWQPLTPETPVIFRARLASDDARLIVYINRSPRAYINIYSDRVNGAVATNPPVGTITPSSFTSYHNIGTDFATYMFTMQKTPSTSAAGEYVIGYTGYINLEDGSGWKKLGSTRGFYSNGSCDGIAFASTAGAYVDYIEVLKKKAFDEDALVSTHYLRFDEDYDGTYMDQNGSSYTIADANLQMVQSGQALRFTKKSGAPVITKEQPVEFKLKINDNTQGEMAFGVGTGNAMIRFASAPNPFADIEEPKRVLIRYHSAGISLVGDGNTEVDAGRVQTGWQTYRLKLVDNPLATAAAPYVFELYILDKNDWKLLGTSGGVSGDVSNDFYLAGPTSGSIELSYLKFFSAGAALDGDEIIPELATHPIFSDEFSELPSQENQEIIGGTSNGEALVLTNGSYTLKETEIPIGGYAEFALRANAQTDISFPAENGGVFTLNFKKLNLSYNGGTEEYLGASEPNRMNTWRVVRTAANTFDVFRRAEGEESWIQVLANANGVGGGSAPAPENVLTDSQVQDIGTLLSRNNLGVVQQLDFNAGFNPNAARDYAVASTTVDWTTALSDANGLTLQSGKGFTWGGATDFVGEGKPVVFRVKQDADARMLIYQGTTKGMYLNMTNQGMTVQVNRTVNENPYASSPKTAACTSGFVTYMAIREAEKITLYQNLENGNGWAFVGSSNGFYGLSVGGFSISGGANKAGNTYLDYIAVLDTVEENSQEPEIPAITVSAEDITIIQTAHSSEDGVLELDYLKIYSQLPTELLSFYDGNSTLALSGDGSETLEFPSTLRAELLTTANGGKLIFAAYAKMPDAEGEEVLCLRKAEIFEVSELTDTEVFFNATVDENGNALSDAQVVRVFYWDGFSTISQITDPAEFKLA